MPTGQPHSAQKKAAVIAALLAGGSVSAVAQEFGIGRTTVRIWRQAAGLQAPPITQQKGADIGDLVAEYLRELLQTLAVQQQHFRDPAWLGTQGAADMAILHGTSADKAFRILGAIRPADGGDGGPPPDG